MTEVELAKSVLDEIREWALKAKNEVRSMDYAAAYYTSVLCDVIEKVNEIEYRLDIILGRTTDPTQVTTLDYAMIKAKRRYVEDMEAVRVKILKDEQEENILRLEKTVKKTLKEELPKLKEELNY